MKAERETELWEGVTPDMMPEEEENGEVYVRHPPSYRSTNVNKFIHKLDSRLIPKSKHPRVERMLGSPRERSIPQKCKKLMLKRFHPVNEEEPIATASDSDSSESDSLGNTSGASSTELC